jgi:hypothetical protein
MRECYVAMPFGLKPSSDGRPIDFDRFFREGIEPAVAASNMACRRADSLAVGAFWQKAVFSAIASSDVMIADLSTRNPNVLYELGLRHVLKRGRTILISSINEQVPFDIAYTRILRYDLDEPGFLSFRRELAALLQQSARSAISDSPLYEFFPDIDVYIPSELTSEAVSQKSSVRERGAKQVLARQTLETPKQVAAELKKIEPVVRQEADADPIQFLTLLRRYRDLSEWDSVIELAQDAPPSSQSPEVRQLLALALNRRGHSGDQERAIALMEALIAETGGDGETFGIIGRIYKDRYDAAMRSKDDAAASLNLGQALRYYKAGFDKSPGDIYPGLNVVSLLQQRDDDAARAELSILIPQLRAIVRDRIEAGRESGRVDYWDLATELQLAVAARDWSAAEAAAVEAAGRATAGWMLETTLRDLKMNSERLTDPTDRSRLGQIIAVTQGASEAM